MFSIFRIVTRVSWEVTGGICHHLKPRLEQWGSNVSIFSHKIYKHCSPQRSAILSIYLPPLPYHFLQCTSQIWYIFQMLLCCLAFQIKFLEWLFVEFNVVAAFNSQDLVPGYSNNLGINRFTSFLLPNKAEQLADWQCHETIVNTAARTGGSDSNSPWVLCRDWRWFSWWAQL